MYIISAVDETNRQIYNNISQSAGIFNITGLDPFTNYRVSVEAVNDWNLTSITEKSITTVETCKLHLY